MSVFNPHLIHPTAPNHLSFSGLDGKTMLLEVIKGLSSGY